LRRASERAGVAREDRGGLAPGRAAVVAAAVAGVDEVVDVDLAGAALEQREYVQPAVEVQQTLQAWWVRPVANATAGSLQVRPPSVDRSDATCSASMSV
jgi:hypothetical protein